MYEQNERTKIHHVLHQRCSTPNQNPNNQREQKHNERKKNHQLVNTERIQKRPKGHIKQNRLSNRLIEKSTYPIPTPSSIVPIYPQSHDQYHRFFGKGTIGTTTPNAKNRFWRSNSEDANETSGGSGQLEHTLKQGIWLCRISFLSEDTGAIVTSASRHVFSRKLPL